jgi:hypothetical protein
MIEMCHRIVPGSRYAVIEDAGHSAYFERPDAFNQAVLGFLRVGTALSPHTPAYRTVGLAAVEVDFESWQLFPTLRERRDGR